MRKTKRFNFIFLLIDGQSVQELLLEEGLAKIRYIFEPNTKYLDIYRAAENRAREEKRRIWSIQGFADGQEGFDLSVVGNN